MNKNRIISKIMLSWFIVVMTIFLYSFHFGTIVLFPGDSWYSSYQSVIQDKYERLIETNEPKIILVGGSNLALGIDQDLLEEKTGYKVVNLGLHAGFSQLYVSELSKANINEGDIVILAYESSWYREGVFDDVGTDLIMSGIDSKIEMYKYFPKDKWKSLIGYTNQYAKSKAVRVRKEDKFSGYYCREAFDNTAQYVAERGDSIIDEDEKTGTVDISNAAISDYARNYLKDYVKYVNSTGAKVFFVDTPIWEGSLACDVSCFYELHALEEKEIGIKYISKPEEYLFPKEYIFDSINHCNEKGMEKRTLILANDINRALEIK